ncbi:hypothetical protein [Salipaludibacillus agaradhaerens]|uniref:hypothetical protein n=1 Tax=Salipaludibacillus agaradhaerens TaxID=76935 RepID=UPI002151921A|nr:hypothetical protein [Salipaludibacillus agaradhaerens]
MDELPPYKENVELKGDGSQLSDKLIKMSHQDSKDPDFLLKAHGYDADEWEIINAKSSIWNQHNKQDGTLTLYASKITVKPKEVKFNWDRVINKINNIKPVIVQSKEDEKERYLNIPLFDMHFGIADYEYYIQTQREILSLLDKPYKEVLFIIGQDLLHNDDFRGRTASGREIEKVDMEKAWEDAMYFYYPLISKALGSKVKIIYSKGNHDESMSWAFVQCLKAKFPQVECDDSFKERKVHMLGSNFVGMNHGDKKKEVNLTENFAKEFPIQWSSATTTEIFVGHLHTERLIDKEGVVIRRMPTGNKVDQWHADHGYTTAHKRFQVFEYTEKEVKTIHYV